MLSQKSLPTPRAFPGPHKLWVSKTLCKLSLLVPVLSLCQDSGAALLFPGITVVHSVLAICSTSQAPV